MIDLNKLNTGLAEEKPKGKKPEPVPDPPAGISPQLDIEAAIKVFSKFDESIKSVSVAVNELNIETDADAAKLTETLGVVKQLIKKIEGRRKEITKKARNFFDGVNAIVRIPRRKLEALEKTGKQKLGVHNHLKELERRKKEAAMQAAAHQQQQRINEEAKRAHVDPVQLPAIKLPQRAEPTRTETATASTKYKKVPKVTDFKLLPDEYKMVDEKKLKAAIAAGLQPPGVEIVEEPIVSIRSY